MGNENDNDYEKYFQKFKEYVNQTNAESTNKNHQGYLIDFNEFENLSSNKFEIENESGPIFGSSRNRKPKLTTKTPNNLKNQINTGKRFVLINNELYEKICERKNNGYPIVEPNGEPNKISYRISKDHINVYVGIEVLKFRKNEKNLIGESTLDEQDEDNNNNNNNKIIKNDNEKIYTDILKYYDMEKDFQNQINVQNNLDLNCFLVDKVWDDKWKKYSYYDSIKTKYLQNNIKKKATIIEEISEEQNKNNYNYDDVNDLENYLANDQKEVYDSLKNLKKSYVILRKTFIRQFNIKKSINPIHLKLSNQFISIEPIGDTILHIKISNNIILKENINIDPKSQNPNLTENNDNNQQNANINQINSQTTTLNNNIYTSEYLKHLIRAIYFKKEFLNPYNQFQNNITQVYLIRNDIINDLKTKFKLNEIILKIENETKLKDITYQDFENKFHLILENINNSDINYFNSVNQYNSPAAFNFIGEKSKLNYKYINNQEKLKYIDDFEIIDSGFAFFLQKFFSQNIHLPAANFIIIDNLILLIINVNNEFIYEIISYDSNCGLKIEYLMELISFKFLNRTQLNTYTFQFFHSNGIKKLISSGNPIREQNNNISFNIFPINFNKSIQTNITESAPKLDNSTINNTNLMETKATIFQSNNQNSIDTPMMNTVIIPSYQIIQAPIKMNNQTDIFPKKNNTKTNNLSQSQMTLNHPILEPQTRTKIENNKEDENKLNYFLKIGLELTKEREALLNDLSTSKINNNVANKEYYVINKNYTKNLEQIFHMQKIKEIMDKHPEQNDTQLLNLLKNEIPDNLRMEIYGLHRDTIQNNLNDKKIWKLEKFPPNNYNKTDIYYLNNIDIISKEMTNKLYQIDKYIFNKCNQVKCLFEKNKIIIHLGNQIINIMNYTKENVYIEYIIKSEYSDHLFSLIKNKGYNSILPYLPYRKLNIPIIINQTKYNIPAYIYELSPQGNIIFGISPKLKVLILLAISQYYFNYDMVHKVYLVNPEWLKQFGFNKIQELVNKNMQVIKNLNMTDLKSLSSIPNYLDKNELKKRDDNVLKPKQNPNESFEHYIEEIKMLNRSFYYPKNFVLVNQQIVEYIKQYFGISINQPDILYVKKQDKKDIIIMKNYPLYFKQGQKNEQNLIIIGQLNKIKNKYEIQNICEFLNGELLEKELEEISKNNFNNYINKRIY